MSFFKKLGQVAADTANVIQKKSTELKTVYEKEKFSGLMSVAEKNLETLSVATSDYLDNLKKVNETVIHETAKNANSSFEAIWRSTFAVSKETLTFVSRDLKNQALKLYKAWEDVEVEKVTTPELKMLYDATKVVNPSTLMTFCGATKEGAVYTINNIQVDIYGEVWISPNAPDKQNLGSMSLLQYIIVNSTEENLTDELLLRQCLSMMYKIAMVRQEYDRLYADYLAANPEITPLATPFDEREVQAKAPEAAEAGETDATATVVETVKVGAKQALEKGIKGVEVLSQKVKEVSSQATKDIKDAWTPKEKSPSEDAQGDTVNAQAQESVVTVNEKEQALENEVQKLRQQLAEANAKAAQAPVQVAVPEAKPTEIAKPATKRATPKAKTETVVKKPATKRAAPKKTVATTEDKPAVKKPVRKKSEGTDKTNN